MEVLVNGVDIPTRNIRTRWASFEAREGADLLGNPNHPTNNQIYHFGSLDLDEDDAGRRSLMFLYVNLRDDLVEALKRFPQS
jgi:hypothetical protein